MSPIFSAQPKRRRGFCASPFVRFALSGVCVFGSSWSPAFAADPLTFDQALVLAEQHAPQLTAQAASVRAAENEAIRAPQLPDPKLIAGVENLPVNGPEAFSLTSDNMTMRKIGVMQEFPLGEKRRLRGELANADVRKEDAQLTAQRLEVRRRTADAWIALALAEREYELLVQLRDSSDLTIASSQAAFKSGKAGSADLLATKVERVQLEDRIDASMRNITQARSGLARWVGAEAANRPAGELPDFSTLGTSAQLLLSNVGAYAAVLPYDAMEARAETDAALARAEKRPDWSLEVAYAQRGPQYSNMINVEVRVDLPLFASHRQDPNIAAKLALVDRVRAEREDVERVQREETEKTLAAWSTAQKRLKRTREELVPLALERAEAALAAYRGGRGELASVVSARASQIDARLAYISQLGDLARAWTALNYLVAGRE